MGRKSLAERILKELKERATEGLWLVVYDFEHKVPKEFYYNLHRLMNSCRGGIFVQRSVIECRDERLAEAIRRLAKHYGAKVKVYKVIEK